MGDKKEKLTIVITSVSGPEEQGKHLVHCYYKPQSDDTYDFFDKEHKEKKKGVKIGEPFSFPLDLHVYTLTLDPEPDKPEGYWGSWSTRSSKDPSNAEGTYQAEAGGAGEEEDPHAASAGGY